jgi:predicted acyltransferase
MSTEPRPQRLLSLDALRGFDMFWIIGGDWLVESVGKRWPSPAYETIAVQFSKHCEWEGFRFYDCIFPLFLFIIGATLPYSVGRRLEQGASKKEILKKVFVRFLWLTFFGLLINGLPRLEGWEHLRLFGVLQRQAFGYVAAALIYLYTKPKTQLALIPILLLVYWALLAWVPVPGFPRGTYTPEGNVANYFDRLVLLPGQLYKSYGDPEGPLSNLPSIASALIGLLAGTYLKQSADRGTKKAGCLAGAGIALFALGWLWNPLFPVIKKLWTSSFVCVAGGLSLVLLALFYYILDVKKWRWGSIVFLVIGMNAITAYMGAAIIPFDEIAMKFLEGVARLYPENKELCRSFGSMFFTLLALWGLYKKDVFLRV